MYSREGNNIFTRHTPLLILTLFLFFLPTSTLAQQPPFEPETLPLVTIELWPDFDRPETLVLVTVSLPAATPTPVRLRLPLPPEATLNAVAYSEQGDLVTLTTYERQGDELVITSPTPGVRLEYYLPLPTIDDRRVVEFAWTAPHDIQQLDLSIQEPAFGRDFVLDQPFEDVVVTGDGLRTRRLPSRPLGQGETAVITADYDLPDDRLTAMPEPASPSLLDNLQANWPWTAAGIVLLAVALYFGWQVWRDRRPARVRKPARRRHITCPNCGTQNPPGSNYCRRCGTDL